MGRARGKRYWYQLVEPVKERREMYFHDPYHLLEKSKKMEKGQGNTSHQNRLARSTTVNMAVDRSKNHPDC